MNQGRNSKIEKYTSLKKTLEERTGAQTFAVLPIIFCTRGVMPKTTFACLKELRISNRATLRTISLIVLRCSIEIYHIFMDYNRLTPGELWYQARRL